MSVAQGISIYFLVEWFFIAMSGGDNEDKIRKLDEALLEGRISEKTYWELRRKYEAEKSQTPSGTSGGLLDALKRSAEKAKLSAEITALKGKMDLVAREIGHWVYNNHRHVETLTSDPKLRELFAKMDELAEQVREKEERLRS